MANRKTTTARRPSQLDMILNHFKVKPSISPYEARSTFRIDSLPRRIMDLKEKGHRFSSLVKQDSSGKKYTRYYYLGHAEKLPVATPPAFDPTEFKL